jgi:hypothetical protein
MKTKRTNADILNGVPELLLRSLSLKNCPITVKM